jgi:secreted trypsin-like serine protease
MKHMALLVVALGLAGCAVASPSSTDTEETSAPIVGGVDNPGDPSIVAIHAKREGGDKGGLCTSTLIAPTVLLTAAHCVSPQALASLPGTGEIKFVALTSANLTDTANPSPRLPIKETHFDPEFNLGAVMNGHDIAVAILAEPMTGVPIIPVNLAPLDQGLTGTQVRLVGYGLSNGVQQTGAGVKRQADVPLVSFDEKLVTTGTWFGTTMCNGDSGGPVLANINGVETVIGVNSFGFIACIGTGQSTRVDAYKAFIQQYL